MLKSFSNPGLLSSTCKVQLLHCIASFVLEEQKKSLKKLPIHLVWEYKWPLGKERYTMEHTASYSALHDSIDGEFMLVSRAKVVNCFAVAKSVHCQKTLFLLMSNFYSKLISYSQSFNFFDKILYEKKYQKNDNSRLPNHH